MLQDFNTDTQNHKQETPSTPDILKNTDKQLDNNLPESIKNLMKPLIPGLKCWKNYEKIRHLKNGVLLLLFRRMMNCRIFRKVLN